MPKTSKKLADLLAKQDETAKQIAELEAEAAQELGTIAVQAGLHKLDLTNKQLQEAFAELVARFSKTTEQA